MWKDEDGKVYTDEDLFNEALEECHSEESAYDYIDTLNYGKEFGGNLIMTETVKKLIIKIKQKIKLCNSALSSRTLEDLINKYENELVEKDRKIDLLLTANR